MGGGDVPAGTMVVDGTGTVEINDAGVGTAVFSQANFKVPLLRGGNKDKGKFQIAGYKTIGAGGAVILT